MAWSPLDAMEAYMHTLHLCKEFNTNDHHTTGGSALMEPKCMEFISALAAGNRARLLLNVECGGFSPLTLALAVAARHGGGRLVCIRADQQDAQDIEKHTERFDLGDVSEIEMGEPREVVKRYEDVEFAVVDRNVEGCVDALSGIKVKPSGGVVVVSNIALEERGEEEEGTLYARVVKSRGGDIESVVLPICGGLEVAKMGRFRGGRGRRHPPRRSGKTFLVYE
ncbi:uncharacterized protein [Typha latifolia]|uniref:uncharacterized protein n=1 Tax=Typha latifolia TaxID=4733 RepID=UPI003C300E4C